MDKDDGELSYSWHGRLVNMLLMPPVPHTVKRVLPLPLLGHEATGLDTNLAARPVQINQRVNVAVPGLGLMLIDEVRVCTNYCTDSLQDELREGWHILAICPQPDQRRPDYVLGRKAKEEG